MANTDSIGIICQENLDLLLEARKAIVKAKNLRLLRGCMPGVGEPMHWYFAVLGPLGKLYDAEQEIFLRVKGLSKDEERAEACKSVLAADEDSKGEKAHLYVPFRQGEAAPLKKALREMVKSHWVLMQEIEGRHPGIAETLELGVHVQAIKSVLDELRWLFGVFVCYSHKDTAIVERVVQSVAAELSGNRIDVWRDREENRERFSRLPPGKEYTEQILEVIEERDVALVFQSKATFESNFIMTVELPRLQQRSAAGEMLVLPLVAHADGVAPDWMNPLEHVPSEGDLAVQRSTVEWEELCKRRIVQPIIEHYNGGARAGSGP